jgi:hypothetical protein
MTLSEKVQSTSQLEKRLGLPSGSLFDVFIFETAGTLSPAVKSSVSSATGLIQFLEKTAVSLGTTTEQLKTMSFDQQLNYVEKYYKQYINIVKASNDPLDVYLAVLYPVLIGKQDSAVMTKKGASAYSANIGLDFNKDGSITKGEIRTRFYNTVNNFRAKNNLSLSSTFKPFKLAFPLIIIGVIALFSFR